MLRLCVPILRCTPLSTRQTHCLISMCDMYEIKLKLFFLELMSKFSSFKQENSGISCEISGNLHLEMAVANLFQSEFQGVYKKPYHFQAIFENFPEFRKTFCCKKNKDRKAVLVKRTKRSVACSYLGRRFRLLHKMKTTDKLRILWTQSLPLRRVTLADT